MNQSQFYGRFTRDPELRYTPGGVAVVSFTLAVDREFKPQGQDRPDADFVNFIAWRGAAETIANHFRKGKPMLVKRARYQQRKGNPDENGKVQYYHEFVVEDFGFSLSDPTHQGSGGSGSAASGSGAAGGSYGSGSAAGSRSNNQDPFADDGRPIDISDDDLPF